MPPPLILRIIGDATSYFKTADATIATNTKLAASFGEVSKASKLSADAEIAAATKAIAAQRARVDALQAANAKLVAGSDAAVAGRVALADAESKLNRQLGVTTIGTRASGAAAQTAERDVGKLTRGLLAGSGVAASLGRSLAFASTGFIAVAGAATIITSSIKAALNLAAAQHRTDQQLKTGGKSWDQYGARISATEDKLRKVAGFTDTDLLQAFSVLFRASNNVGTSLRFMGVAADAARALNKPLAATSVALGKALGGNLSALRRLGVTIPQNLKGMQALAFVQAKFAGQAQASTTVSQRFGAELEHSEAIIGTALLPTFTRLVGRLGDWLAKMNESGRLQRDVNEVVKIGGDVFHTLGAVIGIADRVTGSFKNTLEALIALKFASIVAGWIGDLEKLSLGWQAVAGSAGKAAAAESAALGAGGIAAAEIAGAGAGAAAGATRGRAVMSNREAAAANNAINRSLGRNVETSVATGLEAGIAGGAAVAATKLGGLKSVLTGLASKPIAILVALTFIPPSGAGKSFLDKLGLGFLGKLPLLGPLDSQVANLTKKLLDLNKRLPVSPFPGLSGTAPGPATPDTTFRLGADTLIAGTSDAYKALTDAGAHLPDIARVTAKQELLAAKLLNKAAEHSQKVAKQIADSLVLLDHVRAQVNALTAQGSPSLANLRRGSVVPQAFQPPGFPAPAPLFPKRQPTMGVYDFGGAKPLTIWASYRLTITEQVAQVQAALTKSTRDDVTAAKEVIARIKRQIDLGHLQGNSLVQALQAELAAQGTIQSAAQAAAQKAQEAAARAKAIASSFATSVDLQIAQVQAEMTKGTADDARVLREIIAQARKALASGKKNRQGQLAALQTILQAQQTLQGLTGQSATNYTLPARLQLALAKAQATGQPIVPVLLRMKAALERALKAAKGNIQKQTDIYNQIYGINQQLGQDATNAYGDYKKAGLKWETAGLGLTPEQRRALGARLSQVGPGGTRPMEGTGAAGYAIDPATGRPIHRRERRGGSSISRARPGPEQPIRVDNYLNVYIDGDQVEAVVTERQQRNHGRRPTQRRGPNAATR